ncbi:hypothetical protein [Clostridium butyricum]|nr:hypothetical protein [Clostridium butyricum]
MNSQVKSFEGQDVRVQTDEGVTLINLAHTAKCCGLVENKKNGRSYIKRS